MKSKLKPVAHGVTVDEIENDIYHCCRWCHYFESGKCYNKNVMESYADAPVKIYEVAEEGKLSGVLEETFHSIRKNAVTEEIVKLLRSYNLSEKRIKEVHDCVINSIDQWFDEDVKEKLDSAVSRLYQDSVEHYAEVDGVEISNPEDHYCREFM